MRQKHVIFAIITFCAIACDRIMPGGAWEGFEKELIIENQSDQGPWGGRRSIHWISNDKHFVERDVLNAAISYGWSPVDTVIVRERMLEKWTDGSRQIFPFYFDGNYSGPRSITGSDDKFRRWIRNDMILYRMKTNWMLFQPGTNETTAENGFLLISMDGHEMTMYHLWGE
jgi:hypothetical protein